MSLKVELSEKAGNTHLHLSGIFDETAELPDNADVFAGELIINMAGIKLINSLGCRIWVLWINGVKAQKSIQLVECSPAVIGQASILKGFLPPHARVESFFAPYECTKCGVVNPVLYKAAELLKNNAPQLPEQIPCPKCGKPQTLEVVPQKYLLFLTGAMKARKTS